MKKKQHVSGDEFCKACEDSHWRPQPCKCGKGMVHYECNFSTVAMKEIFKCDTCWRSFLPNRRSPFEDMDERPEWINFIIERSGI